MKNAWWTHYEGMDHKFGAMPGRLFLTHDDAAEFMNEEAKPYSAEVDTERSSPDKILVNMGADRFGWIIKVEVH